MAYKFAGYFATLVVVGLISLSASGQQRANPQDIARRCLQNAKSDPRFKDCKDNIPMPQLAQNQKLPCGDSLLFVRFNNLGQSQSYPFGPHILCSINLKKPGQKTEAYNLREFPESHRKEGQQCATLEERTTTFPDTRQVTREGYCQSSSNGGYTAESSVESEDYTIYQQVGDKKEVVHSNVTLKEYGDWLLFGRQPEGRGRSRKNPKTGGTPTGV